MAEQLGFKAVWVRDVPLDVPSFGDVGQLFDPFSYLGYLAGLTKEISLGIASIALPLHHPVHVSKSAATIDQLSDGRLILGVASGDRMEEYPAMGLEHTRRGELFRQAFSYIRAANEKFPVLETQDFGQLNGKVDILPKSKGHKLPILLTGNSRQTTEWITENADGWMYYPRNFYMQQLNIKEWRELLAQKRKFDQPFMQPLYIDLQDNDDFLPQPIHLGFRIGTKHLIEYIYQLKEIGVNHLALNLRFNTQDIEKTMEKLAKEVLPHFHISTN